MPINNIQGSLNDGFLSPILPVVSMLFVCTCSACPNFFMSFEKYFKDIGIATARPSIEMGVAHRRKSINVSLALIATSTPMGYPLLWRCLPIFVANTIIITNGMGFTFRRAVKCSTVAVMKSMDVTSSTSAANIPDISIRIIISFFGLLPTLFRIFSSRCSKKCLQYGILVNILLGGFNHFH